MTSEVRCNLHFQMYTGGRILPDILPDLNKFFSDINWQLTSVAFWNIMTVGAIYNCDFICRQDVCC